MVARSTLTVQAPRERSFGPLSPAFAWWAFAAFLMTAVVVRGWLAGGLPIDTDESQHLHAAWLVRQGQVPYRDFWEQHTPFLYYLLAPLTGWLADRPQIYVVARAVMGVFAAGVLFVVYRLGRRLSGGVAMVAVLLLAFNPQFAISTTQIRPDVPQLLAWLLCLLALVRWRESGGSRWLWLAGLALGVGAAFTPKMMYGAFAITVVVLFAADGARRIVGALVTIGAAALAPMLVVGVILWATGGAGALRGFVTHIVLENVHFPFLIREAPARDVGLAVYGLALVGGLLVARDQGWRLFRSSIHGPVMVTALVMGLVLIAPVAPAVYQYSWLPVLPSAAIYASCALIAAARRAGRSSPGWGILAILLAVVVTVVSPISRTIQSINAQKLDQQLDRIRLKLTYACPGEPVLDGTADTVFRPSASYYHVLVHGVRMWIADGHIGAERMLDDYRQARAPVADPDRRLVSLGEPVRTLLTTFYVPGPNGLRLAGARVSTPDEGAGGSATIDLLVSARYRVVVTDSVTAAVDGRPLDGGFVTLEAGRHALVWRGRGTVSLVVASCAERRQRS